MTTARAAGFALVATLTLVHLATRPSIPGPAAASAATPSPPPVATPVPAPSADPEECLVLRSRIEELEDWRLGHDQPARGEMTAEAKDFYRDYEAMKGPPRAAILADPRDFLDYAREAEEIELILALQVLLPTDPAVAERRPLAFADFPDPLVDGLLDLLETGSDIQKRAISDFGAELRAPPDRFVQACIRGMLEDDSGLGAVALDELRRDGSELAVESWAALERNADRLLYRTLKPTMDSVDLLYRTLKTMDSFYAGRTAVYLRARLEAVLDPCLVGTLAYVAIGHLEEARLTDTQENDATWSHALETAICRFTWSPGTCPNEEDEQIRVISFKHLCQVACALVPERARPILAFAAERAPTQALSEVLREILRRIDDGERFDELVENFLEG